MIATNRPTIPIAKPELGEEEAAAAREAILSGWVTQGPQVAAFEERVRPLRRRPARLRGVELHDRPAPGPARAGRRPGRRGGDGQPLVHRHRQRGPLLRGDAGVRGHRPADLQHRPGPARSGDHAADQGDHAGPPDGPAVRPGGDPGRRRTGTACRSSRTRPARSVARSGSAASGSGSAGRTGRSPASRSTRGRSSRPATAGCSPPATRSWTRKFRLLRQHAMSVPDTVRHAAKTVIFEEYPEVGFNYRMTDIQAAVGRVQLRRLPGILARRAELADRYTHALADVPGLGAAARPGVRPAELPVVRGAGDCPDYPLSRDRADASPARPRRQHPPRAS